jgi:hypothetical protein
MTVLQSADLADLSALVRPGDQMRGADPELAWLEYRDVIERDIAGQERNHQIAIGPSEIGTDCLRCLARKLAGVRQQRDAAWLPYVGTAVHVMLANIFSKANARLPGLRYLTELKVDVGTINGETITGHADLYDLCTAEVTDWKVAGKTTLTKAKNGPGNQYRIQGHLYGRGMTRRGLPVDRVRIAYLPRNAASLTQAVIWSEPYDESVALAALARADAIAKAAAAVGIDSLAPSLPVAEHCFDCPRYDPSMAPPRRDTLADLIHV